MARAKRQHATPLFDRVSNDEQGEAGKDRRDAAPQPGTAVAKYPQPVTGMPSGFQAMWLFAMFDLPVDTKTAKRQYVRFRKTLLMEGFSMLQFSVYARYCPSEEAASVYKERIRPQLPPDGQVRLLSVTERQFGKMEVYFGKKRKATEDKPAQLLLF